MKRKLLSVLLILSMLLAACGSTDTPAGDDTTTAEATTAETTVDPATLEYPYETKDLGGREFTILNCEDKLWGGTYHVIDYEDMSGETVSDALYERARHTEDTFNIKLSFVKDSIWQLFPKLQTTVLAAEYVYDAAYTPIKAWNGVPLIGEYGTNLLDIDTIHMDEQWWNQSFAESATMFGDTLYSSIDYVCMMGYTYSNVLFFNKDLLERNKLDEPYDIIRAGKWTYDEMNKYLTAVANLNGDESFARNINGNAVYGLTVQHAEGTMTMLNGSGEFFIERDKDGMPQLKEDVSRMQTAYEKLMNMLSADGACLMYNNEAQDGYSAHTLYKSERSLFHQGPLGLSSTEYRELDFEYGVIPAPKLDAEQDRYYTMVSEYTLSLSIPKTVEDTAEVGMVIDYMAYYGWRDVIPAIQETLCYKGMRDEESIEIFENILGSLTLDVGYMYKWSDAMTTALAQGMVKGENNFASRFEANKSSIVANMEKTLATMKGE